MVALCAGSRAPLRESVLNKLKPCCEHTALHKMSHSWGVYRGSSPEMEQLVMKYALKVKS